MGKYFLDFAKKHPFLFMANMLSAFISVFCFLYFLFFYFDLISNPLFVFVFFVPSLFIMLISFLSAKLYLKYPTLTKVTSGIFNLLIIIYFQIFGCFVILSMVNFFPKNIPPYTSFDKYEEALESVNAKKCIEHFPKHIPYNAKNIQFYKTQNAWFNSEAITLKFNIDKDYIQHELKRYNFKYTEKQDDFKNGKNSNFHKPDAMMTDANRINIENFTFYIINDRESEIPPQNSSPYHYGIAVNDKLNQIIYYYTCPD